jgi:hypothetical protein
LLPTEPGSKAYTVFSTSLFSSFVNMDLPAFG